MNYGGSAQIIYDVINNWYRCSNISQLLDHHLPLQIMHFFPFNSSPILIIDYGTDTIKSGISGNEYAEYITPNTISYNMNDDSIIYFGEDAILKTKAKQSSNVIEAMDNFESTNINWNELDAVYNHTLTKLVKDYILRGIHQNEWDEYYPVLCSEKPNICKTIRKQITEIMFEKHNIPSFLLICDAILALYAFSKQIGCVVSMGYNKCYSVPIKDGLYISKAVQKYEYGGKHILDFMGSNLCERGYDLKFDINNIDTYDNYTICRDITETLSFVTKDYAKSSNPHCTCTNRWTPCCDANYELPDGQVITIDLERYKSPEILFTPNLMKQNGDKNVVDMVLNSIKQTEFNKNDLLKLYGNIVFEGGISMIQGMREKFEYEIMNKKLSKQLDVDMDINLMFSPERKYGKYLVWIGASIVTEMNDSPLQNNWISSVEYKEYGADIINKKCDFEYRMQ